MEFVKSTVVVREEHGLTIHLSQSEAFGLWGYLASREVQGEYVWPSGKELIDGLKAANVDTWQAGLYQ